MSFEHLSLISQLLHRKGDSALSACNHPALGRVWGSGGVLGGQEAPQCFPDSLAKLVRASSSLRDLVLKRTEKSGAWYAGMLPHVRAYEGQGSTSGVFLCCSPSYILRECPSLNLELNILARLAGQ